jgi:hypothetical protein
MCTMGHTTIERHVTCEGFFQKILSRVFGFFFKDFIASCNENNSKVVEP